MSARGPRARVPVWASRIGCWFTEGACVDRWVDLYDRFLVFAAALSPSQDPIQVTTQHLIVAPLWDPLDCDGFPDFPGL